MRTTLADGLAPVKERRAYSFLSSLIAAASSSAAASMRLLRVTNVDFSES
jgi:hypothetical protein